MARGCAWENMPERDEAARGISQSAQHETPRFAEHNEKASAVGGLEFCEVGEQLLFIRKPDEVKAHHLVRAQRRLAACPEAQEHAGDDRTVGLDLDAVLAVAEQVTAAQDVLEEAEKQLGRLRETPL